MQKFDTPAPISAVLRIPAGRVQLIAADRADTTVEVLPTNASKSRDVKAAEQTTVEYADGVLRIETSVKNQPLGPTGSIEVTVKLPAGSQVEAKTASAELRTVGRLGDVAFEGAYHGLTHGPLAACTRWIAVIIVAIRTELGSGEAAPSNSAAPPPASAIPAAVA